MQSATVPVLLITGPPGVGKSSVAERASDLFAQGGVEHAVVDLDELDRLMAAGPELHFANLGAVWSNYATAGATRLVVAWTLDAPGELDQLRAAVPGACVRVCRLRAGPATVVARVALREPPLMREQLKALALKYADRMEREELSDYVVDSDGRSLDEVAAEVAARSGWLPECGDGAEVRLAGGRLTEGVVRVGDSVRRPLNTRSDFVHRLLRHLEHAGFEGAPGFRGVDEHDREILTFVEGWVPPDLDRWADEQVAAAARVLRRYHDATAGADLAGADEVVCHNDPSPCNYVFADALPRALIDFDAAAPGQRLGDVAYACWLWALSSDGDAPALGEQARQLDVFVDAYGMDYRPVLVDAVARRQRESLASSLSRTRSDDPAVADYARASVEWHRREIAWLAAQRDALVAMLAAR